MSLNIDKRKRNREDDNFCDSTPLSKRINNLHINNYDDHTYIPEIAVLEEKTTDNHKVYLSPTARPVYNPELNESQNPFYYTKNKLLHDLHMERLKRIPF
ncbi:uncharacterized protein LOC119667781 [Teleopsis dalmanni]|uniref:uncharacterized protein LOC119667781 n=1 Tax=Teleopsis dalmanni TaxID=139649 RepID=UPI0018CE6074|nr:uncharacterized protein LOC119667781 [Teleopsis dalmanni]